MLDEDEVLSLLKKVFVRSNDGGKLTYTGKKNAFHSFCNNCFENAKSNLLISKYVVTILFIRNHNVNFGFRCF